MSDSMDPAGPANTMLPAVVFLFIFVEILIKNFWTRLVAKIYHHNNEPFP